MTAGSVMLLMTTPQTALAEANVDATVTWCSIKDRARPPQRRLLYQPADHLTTRGATLHQAQSHRSAGG
jgi:hypothetical protein